MATQYGAFIIETRAEGDGFIARVTRKDERHFTLRGNKPHALFGWADTMKFASEAEAIKNAKQIADAAQV